MDFTEGESDGLFHEQEPDGCPPPYSPPSRATKSHHQDEDEGDEDEEDQGEEDEDEKHQDEKHQDEKHQDEKHQDEEGKEQSDEDSVDGEFKEKVREFMDGFRSPYDPQQEPPPRNYAAYHPSFAKVETLCAEVFKEAVTLLESSEYQDRYTIQLVDMIRRKQSIKYDPPSRVAIIGDSGVGKSSLINAILDAPNLASAGSTGSAMTCVITEFHHAPLSQETPFLATVELFGRSEILEMLQEHLQAYYQFHLEPGEDLDEEEVDEREVQARTALDVLIAIFAEQESFQNEDCANEFLSRATSKNDQDILQCFSTWIDELMGKHRPRDGLIYLTASTAEELSNLLEPWVTTNSMVQEDGLSQAPSFWPIVRIVRVGMQSHLLQRGIIVSDLPGFNDTNKVRTMASERYIRECEYYFLVAPIARVQTDDAVHRRLKQAHKLLNSKRALITTKIDDMSTTEKPRNLGATPEDAGMYSRLSRAVAFVGAERNRLRKLNGTQKGKKSAKMESKMTDLMVRKKIYTAMIRHSLVNMRNKKVGTAIRKKYQAMTSDSSWLPIFYVSNKDYEIHKTGYDEEEIPLPLDMTGIKQMRFLISTLPAEGRQNVLSHHWKGNLMSVIASLNTWSSQSAIDKQAELRLVVEQPSKETKKIIGDFIAALKDILKTSLMASIRKDFEVWVQHSVGLSEKWTKINGQSFAAFVRKNGCHKPKGGIYRDWNSELLEPVVKDVNKSWVSFERKLSDCRDDYLARLVKLLDDIRDDLSAIEGVSVLPMSPFLESLPSKKGHLHRSMMLFFAKVLETCRDAKLDVILEDYGCLLMQAMLPIYAKMRAVRGASMGVQRKTLLNDSMQRGEPFEKIMPGLQKAIENGLKKLEPGLVESVHEVFEMVLMDFDSMFVVEELPDPKRDALKDQVKDFVSYARTKVDGQIATEYAFATKGE